jgi:tryptophan synthase alpha chain
MTPALRLEQRLRRAASEGRAALLPYLVAGFPERERFAGLLARVGARADVVEIGLPFSDPTADGPVIAAAAQRALAQGVHLGWVCEVAASTRERCSAGLVLMSYLNPLLAPGLERSVAMLAAAGFEGLIVPDLPLEEADAVRERCDAAGLALVPLIAPTTPAARLDRIASSARGFVYTVAVTGTTGERSGSGGGIASVLARAKASSAVPVALGFGISTPDQAAAAAAAGADGVIVGSRLVRAAAEAADDGGEPAAAVASLVAALAEALKR